MIHFFLFFIALNLTLAEDTFIPILLIILVLLDLFAILILIKKLKIWKRITILQDIEYEFEEKQSIMVYLIQLIDFSVFMVLKISLAISDNFEIPFYIFAIYFAIRLPLAIIKKWTESSSRLNELISSGFKIFCIAYIYSIYQKT